MFCRGFYYDRLHCKVGRTARGLGTLGPGGDPKLVQKKFETMPKKRKTLMISELF